jgi:UDP-N-acetylmuramate dehydrogenase
MSNALKAVTAALAESGLVGTFNAPLARHTVARLGGPADFLVEVNSAEALERACRIAWAHGVPLRILGGGANVLISDLGIRGMVIVNHAKTATFSESGMVVAESGLGLITLARATIERGWDGFGWAIGVPGTLGGAVVNNAGAHNGDMASNLLWADIAEPNKPIIRWVLSTLDYHYRESALKHRVAPFVVLQAALQFKITNNAEVLIAQAEGWNIHRKRTQPPGASLGSMFKNPPGDYAGRLIEAAGLKGTRIGGVIISPIHANFFVNIGGGTAGDYLALINLAQQKVAEAFGISLVLEVELLGEWPNEATSGP